MPRPDNLRAVKAHKLAPDWERTRGVKMTEGAAQELFADCLGQFLEWVRTVKRAEGWHIRLSEVGVQPRRTGVDEQNKLRRDFIDTVHRPTSFHYTRRAADVNLFKDNVWLKSADDVEWQEIGYFWLGLHPNCRWGGTIATGPAAGDVNHLSLVRFPGEGI
jgi:hypothetical protein